MTPKLLLLKPIGSFFKKKCAKIPVITPLLEKNKLIKDFKLKEN